MPGAGKSTVGVILAKQTSSDFIDTDVLIQRSEGRSLQAILDSDGHITLRKIEERIVLSLRLTNHVIATGGSAVYSPTAMTHLKANGVIVFLTVALAALEKRIKDFELRGIARSPGQSFQDLFVERASLYTKYADLTLDCTDLIQEEVCNLLVEKLDKLARRSLSHP